MKKEKGEKGRRLREGEWGEGREEENRKEGRKRGTHMDETCASVHRKVFHLYHHCQTRIPKSYCT